MPLSLENDILNKHGGLEKNSLIHVLGKNPEDDLLINGEPQTLEHSKYIDHDVLLDILTEKQNIFKILSLNCQSLRSKFNSLLLLIRYIEENLSDCNFDAICLQETWFDDNTDTSYYAIEGYELISKGKTCSSHGGLAIYLKNIYSFQRLISDIDNFDSWEHQFIEISLKNQRTKFVLGNIYRLPRETNQDYKNFTKEFSDILHQFEHTKTDVVIFGDYNIDLLQVKEKARVNNYFDFIISKGYIPKITLPTRFSRNTLTLIDNALCKLSNNFSNTSSYILMNNMSDPQPYFLSLDYISAKRGSSKHIRYEKYDQQAIDNFKLDFSDLNFDNLLNFSEDGDPDINYNILDEQITIIKERNFPIKYLKFKKHRHKKSAWITNGLIKSIRFRDKLFVRLKKTPTNTELYHTLKMNLSTYNKILKRTIRAVKTKYYYDTFSKYSKDIKHTWSTIKDLVNQKKDTSHFPDSLLIEGNISSDPTEICKKFNLYFNSIGPSLASKICPPQNISFRDYLGGNRKNQLVFKEVTQKDVDTIIRNLPNKSSRGVDNMSVKFVRAIRCVLVPPLTKIINQTLKTGIFPNKLKIAKIIPIHKGDDPKLVENYRPISVLPAISKIFEKVISIQITNHFVTNKLFYGSQYGFRKDHSTELAVIENIDKIAGLIEDRKFPLNIFLDLSKAFDTLDHDILLNKLYYYGIRDQAYDLCKSYLTNRQQFVRFHETDSSMLPIETGVPQGSILGPLFFLIYLNDFDKSSSMFKFIIYADDTTLFSSVFTEGATNIKSMQSKINKELKNVNNWLKVNRLSLNVKKTKFMIFHTPQRQPPLLDISIESNLITQVDSFDYLGIKIDKCLSWKAHTEKIGKKISKVTGVMNRLKHFVPSKTLLLLYNSLVFPHLIYGILLWGHKSNKIQKLQRKSVRTVAKAKYNSDPIPLMKKFNILKVQDILKLQEYKICYKLAKKSLPEYFKSYTFERHSDVHDYETRGNDNLVVPRVNYEMSKCSLKLRLPDILNNLPSEISEKFNTHSIYGLCFYFKRITLPTYESDH